jgi:tetratricopeptide (TPR) repeat protein
MRETVSHAGPRSAEVSRVVIELIARAQTFASECRIAEARSAFHAAVVADDTPRARLECASFLVTQGDTATAELQLRSALDLAHARNRHDERGECCLALASVSAERGDVLNSSRWLQQAVKWELADRAFLSADIMLQLGLHAIRRRDLDEARDWLQRAFAFAGDDAQAGIILHLAVVDRLLGDLPSALAQLTDAHRRFRTAGDLEGCAFALINAGHVLLDLSRGEESSRCFDQARRIFEMLGQPVRSKRAAGFVREVRRVDAVRSHAYLLN